LISKLDKRLGKSSKKSDKNFKRLQREDGEPLVCPPPAGTPTWAVDVSFQMLPQVLDSDDSGGTHGQGSEDNEITANDNPSESLVESEADSDFALELN